MSFEEDLVRGKRAEETALNYIKKKYAGAYIINGYCKEWDIYIPSIGQGVEVKYDPMSKETGNIVIEVSLTMSHQLFQLLKHIDGFFIPRKK